MTDAIVIEGILARPCPPSVMKNVQAPLFATACGVIFAGERISTVERTRLGRLQTFVTKKAAQRLSPCKASNGYLEVAICINGIRKKLLVHRLVGAAWVEGYAKGLSINHINGNKTDNAASNLEWVSLADNTRHQWATGLVDNAGEKHPSSKLTTKQVVYIRDLLGKGISAHALAVISGVDPHVIIRIRDGIAWKSAAHMVVADFQTE